MSRGRYCVFESKKQQMYEGPGLFCLKRDRDVDTMAEISRLLKVDRGTKSTQP
jgi:hypothetical protein